MGHEGYVSAVTVGLPSERFINGTVVTGCQDGKIRVFDPFSPNPIATLTGHTDTGIGNCVYI